MEESTIDAAKHMAPGVSRRRALRVALGGAAAATAGAALPERGGARKKRRKDRRCRARALGAACATTLHCCPNETNRICAFGNGLPGPICCGVLGASCTAIGNCCGGFTCFEGKCAFAG